MSQTFDVKAVASFMRYISSNVADVSMELDILNNDLDSSNIKRLIRILDTLENKLDDKARRMQPPLPIGARRLTKKGARVRRVRRGPRGHRVGR